MGRNRKTHHSAISSDFQVAYESADGHTLTAEGQAAAKIDTVDEPSEIAQEIWESLREEFYEQIEQLPLSLHRSFAVIGEQDKEVQACQAELLPAIRSYVKLRHLVQANAQLAGTQAAPDSQSPHRVISRPSALTPDHGIQFANPDLSELAEQRSNEKSPSIGLPVIGQTPHKEEDIDVNMGMAPSPLSISPRSGTAELCPPAKLQGASMQNSINMSSQSATRTQGLRETDATVPKSVPFPPRQKPKTNRELLTRISSLTGELLRASEEKVGLATAAYDSVDRQVRALDAAIREHRGVAAPGPDEGVHPMGKVTHEGHGAAVDEGEGEEDEEPQLGMIGPLAETDGRASNRSRRNRKGDRREQQKHVVNTQPPTRVLPSSTAPYRELPSDPREPRYCYCNQVSYGEMIACDNADCSREWFHLGCAGLAAPPRGRVKWYCRDCEEMLGNNRRRRIR
ncbi:hypothetical protein JB92DRAFT_3035289 [Gautieria morchelliformis]|nr:hypothetical protein JB92DRAFT_3035289 [Gautieria morchelliformis]